ncbi:hypothetical protein OHD41_12475 [Escherichia coli]|nr:hypothetical protein [Escherichia coli]
MRRKRWKVCLTGDAKDGLNGRLAKVDGIDVPAVDENGNGKPDAEEAAEAVNAATAKVAEAEAKEKEAEAALTQAKADNKITQQEHDDLAAKNDAVTAAKADAAKAVEGLLTGDAKDGLNGRLAKVDGIDVPAVDENGNGKPDAEEAAEAVNAATAKVAEAEAKEKEAEAALTQAKADNKITQQEHDDLAAKNDAVTAAKADAAKAVEGLLTGDAKDGLNGRLAKVDGIDVPAVDENGNGKPDAEEAAEAVNAATAKVAEAEAKEKEAEAALTQAKADNKITQQEHDDLAAKNDAVTAAKADAAKAVEGLLTGDAKDGLNGRLAKVDGIDVPAVDENGNGKPDAEEAAEAVNAATAKVAEAEAKEKEAEAALTQAKADNKITQQEHDDLAAKNDAVTAAKADAAKAVEGLLTGDAKDGLNGRLAKVDGIDVPAVDENGNGKPDAEEAAEAVNAATAKVAEAEAKEKEAEAALTQAKADNKITQQEHDDLAAKNDAVTAAKADAAKAVEGLLTGDAKDGLNGRLAKVDGIDVPAVDENGNGKPDAEEAAEAVNAATAKVAEAEAKEKEAEAALTQAKADNKITQQEHDDLAAKNDAVTAAKADAAKAVEGLLTGDAKDGLNGRLAKVDGIDVPAVDENGNGKPDAEEAAEAVNAATAKVAEAEAKEKEAEAALTQAKADNKITQQEHDDLAAKNDAVTAAKADAAKAVEGLPYRRCEGRSERASG